jgi:transcriptional regulator with PAS, ATPase and Fis domain
MQVKLLRVIETHEYTPVGATISTKADIRIISATNRNLEDLCQQGKLRNDFYYRIRVIPIIIPPLRERREDIPLLTEHFWEKYATGVPLQNLPVDLLEQLYLFDWPGNVRQLQNTLQHYLATGQVDLSVAPEDAGQTIIKKLVHTRASSKVATPGLFDLLGQIEKEIILNALKHQAGKKHKTAEMLGIDRRTLYQKIKKHGIK